MYMTGGNTQLATAMTGNYGSNVGSTSSGTRFIAAKSFGITADSSESGIEAEVSSTVKYVIKY